MPLRTDPKSRYEQIPLDERSIVDYEQYKNHSASPKHKVRSKLVLPRPASLLPGLPKDVKVRISQVSRDTKMSSTSLNSLYEEQEFDHFKRDASGSYPTCPSITPILSKRSTWFTRTITMLAIYSVVMSGILLGIALARPRWGYAIGPHGKVSYGAATLLSAVLSKSVELTFATIFVATLGQILSRRAVSWPTISGGSHGLSMAEINMKLWILQPGTIITHWIGARYVLPSFLGLSALSAAFGATFYTTAAQALVSPKLRLGSSEVKELEGQVSASYANILNMVDTCSNPFADDNDENSGITCTLLLNAGTSFQNLNHYLQDWADRSKSRLVLDNSPRPYPVVTHQNDTRASGQWLSSVNDTLQASHKWGRLVHNLTMAMPHANLYNAARLKANRIIQPIDLNGAGEYYIQAAIPAPSLNVLCVGGTAEEMAPMIGNSSFPPVTPMVTVFDKFFGWAPDSTASDSAPWFPKLPNYYNTMLNVSDMYGPARLYMLGQPGPDASSDNQYTLCGLASFLHTNCTTAYHLSQAGSELAVYCGADPQNTFPYQNSVSDKNSERLIKDWKDVAIEWGRSVALSAGATDSNSSMARMITKMIPTWGADYQEAWVSDEYPSIAETLALMAAHTLLLSSQTSPFVDYWDYAHDVLKIPAIAKFRAQVSYKDYSSGPSSGWENLFYIVLVVIFFQSCFCFAYLAWAFRRHGSYTDLTETQNLFTIALGSPAAKAFTGACGGGPTSRMLVDKWRVNMSGDVPGRTAYPHCYVDVPEDGDVKFSETGRSSFTDVGSRLRSHIRIPRK